MTAMEPREAWRVQPGLEVYDRDGDKLGTVAHLHQPEDGGPGTAEGGPGGHLEVTTGLLSRLGLARPLIVPLAAVRDVNEGGVFLTATRAEVEHADWHTGPDAMAGSAEMQVAPAPEVVAPMPDAPSIPQAVAELADWSAAVPHYRRRWEAQPGPPGERWVTYEPRYRFAWEMARLPGYDGLPWPRVRPELRARWEAQHPEVEWDTVDDSVRDAWEHVAGAVEVGAPGASSRR